MRGWPPSQRPPAAAAAGETLAGSLQQADNLPPDLVVAAVTAFTDGVKLAAGVTGGVAVLVAVVAVVLLRQTPTAT